MEKLIEENKIEIQLDIFYIPKAVVIKYTKFIT